jgi:hypothetical protein
MDEAQSVSWSWKNNKSYGDCRDPGEAGKVRLPRGAQGNIRTSVVETGTMDVDSLRRELVRRARENISDPACWTQSTVARDHQS